MTDRNDGGAAFPTVGDYSTRHGLTYEGLSIRDYFAAAALTGIHASLTGSLNCPDSEAMQSLASLAYAQADAMLAARGKA